MRTYQIGTKVEYLLNGTGTPGIVSGHPVEGSRQVGTTFLPLARQEIVSLRRTERGTGTPFIHVSDENTDPKFMRVRTDSIEGLDTIDGKDVPLATLLGLAWEASQSYQQDRRAAFEAAPSNLPF